MPYRSGESSMDPSGLFTDDEIADAELTAWLSRTSVQSGGPSTIELFTVATRQALPDSVVKCPLDRLQDFLIYTEKEIAESGSVSEGRMRSYKQVRLELECRLLERFEALMKTELFSFKSYK